jgi:hypothetical protein
LQVYPGDEPTASLQKIRYPPNILTSVTHFLQVGTITKGPNCLFKTFDWPIFFLVKKANKQTGDLTFLYQACNLGLFCAMEAIQK